MSWKRQNQRDRKRISGFLGVEWGKSLTIKRQREGFVWGDGIFHNQLVVVTQIYPWVKTHRTVHQIKVKLNVYKFKY